MRPLASRVYLGFFFFFFNFIVVFLTSIAARFLVTFLLNKLMFLSRLAWEAFLSMFFLHFFFFFYF